jgi:hypothetical protein
LAPGAATIMVCCRGIASSLFGLHRLLLHCHVVCSHCIHVVSSVSLLSEGRRRRTRIRWTHRRLVVIDVSLSCRQSAPHRHHIIALDCLCKRRRRVRVRVRSRSRCTHHHFSLSSRYCPYNSSRWMKSEGDARIRAHGQGVDASWHCDGTSCSGSGRTLGILGERKEGGLGSCRQGRMR